MKLRYVVIDFGKVIDEFTSNRELRKLFTELPLQDIIDAFLSVNHYIDYSDLIYNTLETLLDESELKTEEIDFDMLEILIETIVNETDNAVTDMIELPDGSYYLLDKWVSSTAAVLEVNYDQ